MKWLITGLAWLVLSPIYIAVGLWTLVTGKRIDFDPSVTRPGRDGQSNRAS